MNGFKFQGSPKGVGWTKAFIFADILLVEQKTRTLSEPTFAL
jgi:hypothetical protein